MPANDDCPQFEPVQPRLTAIVTDMLEEFYELAQLQGAEWNEGALLRAAKMDHQFIARIRKGKSFTTSKIDKLRVTMNKALRMKIRPEQYPPPPRRKAA